MTKRALGLGAITAVLLFLGYAYTPTFSRSQESPFFRALDTSDPIPYFIADGSGERGYRASDRELARWALEAWRGSAGKNLRFTESPESAAIIRVYWSESGDGRYGEMTPLNVGTRRGAAVFIQPDVQSLGPAIASRAAQDTLLRDGIVYLTCVHELGHALGLSHTRDFRDIMYFFGYGGDVEEFFGRYRVQIHSRNDISMTSGLSSGDVKRIKSLYEKE